MRTVSRRLRLLVGVLLIAAFVSPAGNAAAEVRYYQTGWCQWKVDTFGQITGGSGGGYWLAKTITTDRNAQCEIQYAAVKYIGAGGALYTYSCGWDNINVFLCQVPNVEHHQGKGGARDWETSHEDFSPWFG